MFVYEDFAHYQAKDDAVSKYPGAGTRIRSYLGAPGVDRFRGTQNIGVGGIHDVSQEDETASLPPARRNSTGHPSHGRFRFPEAMKEQPFENLLRRQEF